MPRVEHERDDEREADRHRQCQQREPEGDREGVPGLRVGEHGLVVVQADERERLLLARLTFVNVKTSEAIIGTSVNTKNPMIHGAMKM